MELFSKKAIRLVLAVSVSIWLAGGCLFGCANTALCAEVGHETANTVKTPPSCHSGQSHHARNSKQPVAAMPSFVPGPRGMMNECPLVVNSTAATSKNSI